MEVKTKRMRGKSVDRLLMEALEELNNYEHAETVEPERIQSARTRVVTLKHLAAEKKSRKIAKLQSQLKAAQDEVVEWKAKAGEIPPEVTEKIARIESENSDLRQRLLNQPTEVVKEVTVPDPAVIAENTALKAAIGHLATFNFDEFRKIEAVIYVFDKDRAASRALATVFRVPFEDVKALMAKHTSELKIVENTYRSPLADVALAIITYRIKAEAKKTKEKNEMRFAV